MYVKGWYEITNFELCSYYIPDQRHRERGLKGEDIQAHPSFQASIL